MNEPMRRQFLTRTVVATCLLVFCSHCSLQKASLYQAFRRPSPNGMPGHGHPGSGGSPGSLPGLGVAPCPEAGSSRSGHRARAPAVAGVFPGLSRCSVRALSYEPFSRMLWAQTIGFLCQFRTRGLARRPGALQHLGGQPVQDILVRYVGAGLAPDPVSNDHPRRAPGHLSARRLQPGTTLAPDTEKGLNTWSIPPAIGPAGCMTS